MDAHFKADFPALSDVTSKKTSEADQCYNCIAWAFSDNQRHWWPQKRSFWPFDYRGKTVKEAFNELFTSDGWQETSDSYYAPAFQKLALYELNGVPTHAARLLPSGLWTSKLGQNIDLAHHLNDLEGPTYGAVSAIYRKPIVVVS